MREHIECAVGKTPVECEWMFDARQPSIVTFLFTEKGHTRAWDISRDLLFHALRGEDSLVPNGNVLARGDGVRFHIRLRSRGTDVVTEFHFDDVADLVSRAYQEVSRDEEEALVSSSLEMFLSRMLKQ